VTAAPASLAERIDEARHVLSPQEQRVADFLRSRPDESALYNSSELARRTGVSKATVSRLFRRLGFTDSQEARELLRAQRSAGVPVLVDDDDPIAGDAEQLRLLAVDLDRVAVQAAAVALAAAPRVLVIGLRSGFPIAMLLRQALAQARPDVTLAPEAGQTLGEEVAGLASGDVVVVVGLRRRPAGFDRLLRSISVPDLLLIADPSLQPVPARWRFDVPVRSASAFDSYASAASLVSLLASEVLRARGAEGAARVAAIDRTYTALAELDPA
jgi:DNA-binding MurR/RpiR family transcriptional regulator